MELVPCATCGRKDTALLFTKWDHQIVRCLQCGLSYVNPRNFRIEDNSYFEGPYLSSIEDDGVLGADLLVRDLAGVNQSSKWGATISITAEGKVAYTLTDAARAHYQSLPEGEVGTDTFTYAIRLGNGTLSWATATV